ncbi:MAG: MptD family putative ECF transporter S component [Propionibacteriaceae bacterium]|nr:MptD family putative ECF transporter S component [Propionibacteriaceae bacterium]
MDNQVKVNGQDSGRQRLNIKDFMTIGVFFVINSFVGLIVAMLGVTPVTYVMISSMQGLVLGIPTMLFYSKVKKPGMLFIMALISGLVSILLGLGPYNLIIGLVLSLIAEALLWSGKYQSARNSVLAYAVTSLAATATYIPLFFATRNFIEGSEIARKYGAAMAQGMADIGQQGYLYAIIIAATFVSGLIGGFLGLRIFNKHFRRAKIV